MAAHEMFDGRLQLYKRGRTWHCAARVGGQRFRNTTNEENLDRAKDVAEEWYLDLRGKTRRGEIIKAGRTFGDAAKQYLRDVKVLTIGTRSPSYIELLELRMNRHILPFFEKKLLEDVNRGSVQDYRVKRAEDTLARTGKPPARSTMLQEIVHIRHLRHTYISMRLMEGANIHQIANNCRTSVQMIEEFYAAHIKDRLDTTTINIQRPKAVKKAARRAAAAASTTPLAWSQQDDPENAP